MRIFIDNLSVASSHTKSSQDLLVLTRYISYYFYCTLWDIASSYAAVLINTWHMSCMVYR